MAFIIAGIVVLLSGIGFLLAIAAAGMSDDEQKSLQGQKQAVQGLCVGLAIAGIIAATHWLPLSW